MPCVHVSVNVCAVSVYVCTCVNVCCIRVYEHVYSMCVRLCVNVCACECVLRVFVHVSVCIFQVSLSSRPGTFCTDSATVLYIFFPVSLLLPFHQLCGRGFLLYVAAET